MSDLTARNEAAKLAEAMLTPAEKPKHAGGRPSWYRPEHPILAYKLALLGHTNAQMATVFSVSVGTIDRWCRDQPEFRKAIARGREEADADVAAGLYQRAKGYSHDAVKIFMPAGATEPVYAPYTEHYPPDTAAASLWLRNRQPKQWRDKTDVGISGTLTLEHLVLQSMGEPSPAVIEGSARVVDD